MARGDNPEDCHAPQNDYWMRRYGGDACRASDAARLLDESLSSLPAPSPLRSLPSLPTPPLRYALIRTGTLVVCSALQGSKEIR